MARTTDSHRYAFDCVVIFSELDQTILLSKSNASFARVEKINDAGPRCTYRFTV